MLIQQRYFAETRTLEFQEAGLRYERKMPFRTMTVEIPYENILFNQKQTQRTYPLTLAATLYCFLGLFPLATEYANGNISLWALLGINAGLLGVLYVLYKLMNIAELIIPARVADTTLHIRLFNHNPIYTLSLVKEIQVEANKFLRAKYTAYEHDLPLATMLRNLLWLRENGILTPEEWEILRQQFIELKGEGTSPLDMEFNPN